MSLASPFSRGAVFFVLTGAGCAFLVSGLATLAGSVFAGGAAFSLASFLGAAAAGLSFLAAPSIITMI